MSKFQILCTTMHQKDFSKINEMNIHSDVVFANQCDHTSYEEIEFEGHTAKMISTQTRGVGVNRNLTLLYASSDICLLADDDIRYADGAEEKILGEFEKYPGSDVIIFSVGTSTPELGKIPAVIKKRKRMHSWSRNSYGGPRIAFRLSSLKKAGVTFTSLFGGGCVYSSGEDSMFISQMIKCGLKVYTSPVHIGDVSYEDSSWFKGYNEKFFYDKGAFLKALHPSTYVLWIMYMVFRIRHRGDMPLSERYKWMRIGSRCYKKMMSFEEYKSRS